MAEETDTESLIDIAEIVMGQSPRGETYNTERNGYPLLNGPTEFGLDHPTPSLWTTAPTKICEKDDLLFCVRGTTTGRMNWADQQYCIGRGLCAIRAKTGFLDTVYIYYNLVNDLSRLLAFCSGSVFLNLSKRDIEQFKIRWPDPKQRAKITLILKEIDDKIKLNDRVNRSLEYVGQALFKRWFVDFEFPNQEGKPYRSTGGKIQHNEELGKAIPEGWKSGTINDLSESITSGGTPKRMENQYWNGEIAWFKTSELTDDPLIDSEEHITKEGLENSACKLWTENTILIALYASPTVGRLGLLKTKAASNQACSGLVAKKEIGYPFLFYTLFFKRSEFNSIAVGAAQQNINQQIVKEAKTLIPPKGLLNSFNTLLNLFFDKRTLLIRQNRNLSQIRDSLLPKLMSGKIRVPYNKETSEAT